MNADRGAGDELAAAKRARRRETTGVEPRWIVIGHTRSSSAVSFGRR
jgi:hypothetical protein